MIGRRTKIALHQTGGWRGRSDELPARTKAGRRSRTARGCMKASHRETDTAGSPAGFPPERIRSLDRPQGQARAVPYALSVVGSSRCVNISGGLLPMLKPDGFPSSRRHTSSTRAATKPCHAWLAVSRSRGSSWRSSGRRVRLLATPSTAVEGYLSALGIAPGSQSTAPSLQ